MINIAKLEGQRQILQTELDRLKTQEERNVLGQFSTPIQLASSILRHAKKILPKDTKIRFLDPAIGTGSFFSALNNVFPNSKIEIASGFEIDEHYGCPSSALWSKTILDYRLSDFTKAKPPTAEIDKYNLVICNPPYVRHHYIREDKQRLKSEALGAANMNLSSLTGLYCYFIALAHQWLREDGIAGWLIPSEFMDVNYGQAVKDYLLNEVTLLQIHRFEPNDVQFDDALVSSAIVWFKRKKPNNGNKVKFTFGGNIDQPKVNKEVSNHTLAKEKKWTRFPLSDERIANNSPKLSDFFIIKRGLATGDNKFFIIPQEDIIKKKLPINQFRSILPSPRYLDETEIFSDNEGNPVIKNKLFILDCRLPIEQIKQLHPELYNYLQTGVENGVSDRYICRNRKVWYSQENRIESQFYCTYIGRSENQNKKPFRFILNHSKAIVTNSYLILYPKLELKKEIDLNPKLKTELIRALNQISGKAMMDEGRVYGGGMYKLEPKELGNVPAIEIANILIKSAVDQGVSAYKSFELLLRKYAS